MMGNLEAKLLSVGELFGESNIHYQIPIYQRKFAWGAEQVEQMVDDIWSAAQADADDYFLGNLIVARQPDTGSEHVTYEVVDGQQRLTTLFMLLTFLGDEAKAKLTYQSRRTATDALARLVTSDGEEDAGIHSGCKAIKSRLDRFSGESDLRRFKDFLKSQVQLVRAALPDQTDLNKYFEIMNTRGQQLEQVDIVKARLMGYLLGETGGVEEERTCFAWVWDACAEMDSYIQMALTPRDPGTRDKIFGQGWDRLKIRAFDDLLPRQPSGVRPSGAGRSAAIGLREALKHYAQAPESPTQEDEDNQRFESPIKFPSLLLHALKVLPCQGVDDSDDDGRLDDSKLIKLFEAEFKPRTESERSKHTKRFAETLLHCKFVLDNYVIKREFTATNGDDDGAWSLKRLTRGETAGGNAGKTKVNARFSNAFAPGSEEWDDITLDDKTQKVLLLQSMLRVTYTSPRTMHWITRIFRKLKLRFDQTPSQAADDICLILHEYARQKVRQAFFVGERPVGFKIERIVFTYLDYLLAQGKSESFPDDPKFTFAYRSSIEHFFPQHPDKEQAGWQRVAQSDPELNLFGNLALISVGANSKFSNNLPENKIRFLETIQQSAKLQLMARQAQGWDRTAIRDHDNAMVQLLSKDIQDGGIVL